MKFVNGDVVTLSESVVERLIRKSFEYDIDGGTDIQEVTFFKEEGVYEVIFGEESKIDSGKEQGE